MYMEVGWVICNQTGGSAPSTFLAMVWQNGMADQSEMMPSFGKGKAASHKGQILPTNPDQVDRINPIEPVWK